MAAARSWKTLHTFSWRKPPDGLHNMDLTRAQSSQRLTEFSVFSVLFLWIHLFGFKLSFNIFTHSEQMFAYTGEKGAPSICLMNACMSPSAQRALFSNSTRVRSRDAEAPVCCSTGYWWRYSLLSQHHSLHLSEPASFRCNISHSAAKPGLLLGFRGRPGVMNTHFRCFFFPLHISF